MLSLLYIITGFIEERKKEQTEKRFQCLFKSNSIVFFIPTIMFRFNRLCDLVIYLELWVKGHLRTKFSYWFNVQIISIIVPVRLHVIKNLTIYSWNPSHTSKIILLHNYFSLSSLNIFELFLFLDQGIVLFYDVCKTTNAFCEACISIIACY